MKRAKKQQKYPYLDGKISPGQIKATDIIRHVLENGRLYPLPPHYEYSSVFYDLPEYMTLFNHREWYSCSKATFARLQDVAASQVSRWVNAGMPELPDGTLHLMEADEWLLRYQRENEQKQAIGWRHYARS